MTAPAALMYAVVIGAVGNVYGNDVSSTKEVVKPAAMVAAASTASASKIPCVFTWQLAEVRSCRHPYLDAVGTKLPAEQHDDVFRQGNVLRPHTLRRESRLSQAATISSEHALWVRGGAGGGEPRNGGSEPRPKAGGVASKRGASQKVVTERVGGAKRKKRENEALLPNAIVGVLGNISRCASAAWRAVTRGRKREHPISPKTATRSTARVAERTSPTSPKKKLGSATDKKDNVSGDVAGSGVEYSSTSKPRPPDDALKSTSTPKVSTIRNEIVPPDLPSSDQIATSTSKRGRRATKELSDPSIDSTNVNANAEGMPEAGNGTPRRKNKSHHNSGRVDAARDDGRYSRGQPQQATGLGGGSFVRGQQWPVPAAEERKRKEQEVRDGLRRAESELGPLHPTVAALLFLLSRMVQERGGYAEAEDLCTRAVEVFEKTLGPEHPDVGMVLNCLALSWQAQARSVDGFCVGYRRITRYCAVIARRRDTPSTSFPSLHLLYH